jgi:hypothetical protein
MSRHGNRIAALAAGALALAAGPRWAQRSVPPRQFAAGVVTTIPPDLESQELSSGPLALVEPLAIPGLEYDPQLASKSTTAYERSKVAFLRRAVWNLEFSFKPLRMMYVDIPQGSGRMQRKLVWYLVYRVRNLGNHMRPKEVVEEVTGADGRVIQTNVTYEREPTQEVEFFGRTTTELRFFPHFVLASTEYNKEYLDRVIPAALEPIKAREFPGRPDVKLYDSLSISEVPLPISDEASNHGVWGVATWTDIDPRIDYFRVYVQGLTNAYQPEDPPGAYQAGNPPGTGRKIAKKTLQLNFWRPGDTLHPHEGEIRFGARIDPDPDEQAKVLAHYGVEKPIDYLWVYR